MDGPFGTYAAVTAGGTQLLAAELSQRLARVGAAVVALHAQAHDPDAAAFHWGRWFATAARVALNDAERRGSHVDAMGYAGAGTGTAGASGSVRTQTSQTISTSSMINACQT